MTAILGISAFYHDSAAALVVDGRIVAAAQEERFTRVKHDHASPSAPSTTACRGGPRARGPGLRRFLRQAAVEIRAAAGDLPGVRAGRLPLVPPGDAVVAEAEAAPAAGDAPRAARPLPRPLRVHRSPRVARRQRVLPLARSTRRRSSRWTAWASGPRPASASGRGNRIELTHEIRFPHSLGLLYSAFTYYTGFRVNSGEYKVMGLAPYGQPVYKDLILRALDRPEGRRLVPPGHELLQLLPGADDDVAEVPPPVRRAAAQAGVAADAAGNGPGRLDPGGHRGGHAPHGPARPPPDRA